MSENKISKKCQARMEILASLKRATQQARILNRHLDDMRLTLEYSATKKAA